MTGIENLLDTVLYMHMYIYSNPTIVFLFSNCRDDRCEMRLPKKSLIIHGIYLSISPLVGDEEERNGSVA